MMRSLIQITLLASCLICCSQQTLAHPADGYWSSLRGRGVDAGLPVEWSIDDLTFVAQLPLAKETTETEKYMVSGSQGSSFGIPLPSWYGEVLSVAGSFFEKEGYIPQQLTPEVIAVAKGVSVNELSAYDLEVLKSPITGDYPFLDRQSFSPGDLYIKELNHSQKIHFGGLDPIWYDAWFNGLYLNPVNGECQEIDEPGAILYYRVYGKHAVLRNNIYFRVEVEMN